MENAHTPAFLHGYEMDDADQMKRADRVDPASRGSPIVAPARVHA
jgi:hypothetical protein